MLVEEAARPEFVLDSHGQEFGGGPTFPWLAKEILEAVLEAKLIVIRSRPHQGEHLLGCSLSA